MGAHVRMEWDHIPASVPQVGQAFFATCTMPVSAARAIQMHIVTLTSSLDMPSAPVSRVMLDLCAMKMSMNA